MTRLLRCAAVAVLTVLLCAAQAAHRTTVDVRATAMNRLVAELRNSPPELYAFLYAMPKGGDLHNHLSGAIYAESFIEDAAKQGLCVDTSALSFVRPDAVGQCAAGQQPATNALHDMALFGKMIDGLSMRDFAPGRESAHDHFFFAFDRFGSVDAEENAAGAAEVTRRAAEQNESYLELMALSGGGAVSKLGAQAGLDEANFDATAQKLEQGGMGAAVEQLRSHLHAMEHERRATLGCEADGTAPVCRVVVRYLYQVLRAFPKEQVFAQVIAGFQLAASEPLVAGINFVQPEDWRTPMLDYDLHMRMVDYAHGKYPAAHIALHAGELTAGVVPPEGLRFHVREAVETGHAERIGHGVDVMYENDAAGLLREMRERHVVVEINLTSNDLILGVRGKDHPFPVYRKYGVPVVISTDDEGVSRSHLTEEYERAAIDYGLTYSDLKEIARNSLRYSFLPPGEKARLEADLEERFARFETAALRERRPRAGAKPAAP